MCWRGPEFSYSLLFRHVAEQSTQNYLSTARVKLSSTAHKVPAAAPIQPAAAPSDPPAAPMDSLEAAPSDQRALEPART